jgi:integrase
MRPASLVQNKMLKRNKESNFSKNAELARKQNTTKMNTTKTPDKVNHTGREFLTVPQARVVLNVAWSYGPRPCAAYFILTTWAALRESEIRHMNPEDLDLETGKARIKGHDGKTRFVTLMPITVKLLRVLKERGKLTAEALNPSKADVKDVRHLAGLKPEFKSKSVSSASELHWSPNLLRHTALSYHYANSADAAETAKWAGNSASVVHRFYQKAISRQDALAFWHMLPGGIA